MDRIAQIEHIAAKEIYLEKDSLVSALVRCLEPGGASDLLLRTVEVHTTIRSAAIRKICSDIVSGKLEPNAIIAALAARIKDCEPRRRASVAYCLLEIARVCDSALKTQVQELLGTSRYVGLRRRSYKLYDEESEESRALLERSWRQYQDHEAAWLIAKTFPASFLVAEKNELLKSLNEGWELSRLYLRIADVVPECLDELLALDPISYMYVAAKRGMPPPVEIVGRVIDLSWRDERFGLLLWSIGELGLWDVLMDVALRLVSIVDDRWPAS